jgi:regulator of sirC expression with transglutaminase-like and TPR domain
MRSWSRMSESSRKQNAIVDNCPENAELLIYKGHAYKDMGAHHAAIEFYKQAAELDASYSAKADSEIKEIEDFLKNQSCRPSR